jgi:protocatechuate 3,4-dioxygenase beta subunit
MGVATAALLTVVSIAGIQSQGTPAQPAPQAGLILGRVVDAASGRPISGAIVSLEGGIVTAPPPSGGLPRAITNGNGQFVFRRLPKGTFGLTAQKGGYVEGAYGRSRPGGSSAMVELADGQRTSDVVIPMWRFAALAGTVTDEAGEPLVGVEVRAFERRYIAGRRRLSAGMSQSTDDRGMYRFGNLAPGEYVVGFVSREVTMPLSAAELLRTPSNDPKYMEISRDRMTLGMMTTSLGSSGTVQVGDMVRQITGPVPPQPATSNAAVYIYPTQFFPGTPAIGQAAALTLKSGEERGGIDFALRPVKTSRISGTAMGPDGPAAHVGLRLVPSGEDFSVEMETSVTMTGAGGQFTFLGVPPGEYAIKVVRIPRLIPGSPATATMISTGSTTIISTTPGTAPTQPLPLPAEPTLWATVPVGVAETDVSDVIVVLRPGARVSGRLEFDGAAERPDQARLQRIPILVERADRVSANPLQSIPPGRVDASGTFNTYGVPAGQYFIRIAGAPSPWTLRSVTSEGRDVSDVPLDVGAADVTNVVVTFTDRPAKVTGIVRGAGGNPDPAALVVAFPADAAQWKDYGLNPRRFRSARATKSGSYTLNVLPPGDYIVAAVKDDFGSTWQTPEVLEALSRLGSQVSIAEGDTRALDLKMVVVR